MSSTTLEVLFNGYDEHDIEASQVVDHPQRYQELFRGEYSIMAHALRVPKTFSRSVSNEYTDGFGAMKEICHSLLNRRRQGTLIILRERGTEKAVTAMMNSPRNLSLNQLGLMLEQHDPPYGQVFFGTDHEVHFRSYAWMDGERGMVVSGELFSDAPVRAAQALMWRGCMIVNPSSHRIQKNSFGESRAYAHVKNLGPTFSLSIAEIMQWKIDVESLSLSESDMEFIRFFHNEGDTLGDFVKRMNDHSKGDGSVKLFDQSTHLCYRLCKHAEEALLDESQKAQ